MFNIDADLVNYRVIKQQGANFTKSGFWTEFVLIYKHLDQNMSSF